MSYTYSHLEDLIQEVYQDIDIFFPTQLNIYMIADALDIGLYPINDVSQALRSDGRDYIFLNSGLTAPEQFEVFAHELCHLLTHSGNQVAMSPDFIEYQEWQADLFALHFCVPTFMLQKMYLPNDTRVAQSIVKESFGVTYPFAEKRLYLHQQRLQHVHMKRHLSKLFK